MKLRIGGFGKVKKPLPSVIINSRPVIARNSDKAAVEVLDADPSEPYPTFTAVKSLSRMKHKVTFGVDRFLPSGLPRVDGRGDR
jgi:hypothetical protein